MKIIGIHESDEYGLLSEVPNILSFRFFTYRENGIWKYVIVICCAATQPCHTTHTNIALNWYFIFLFAITCLLKLSQVLHWSPWCYFWLCYCWYCRYLLLFPGYVTWSCNRERLTLNHRSIATGIKYYCSFCSI